MPLAGSALALLSITSPTSQKQTVASQMLIHTWVGLCTFRTLWASPKDSPVILKVSPTAITPTDFYIQRFWVCSFPCWNPGFCGLSCFPVVLPSLSAHECGTNWSTSQLLGCVSSPPWLPVSAPPTGWDECFFNSLVVRLPWNLNIWQFWLFFVFKFVGVCLLVVQGSEALLCLHHGRNSWAAFSKPLAYQYRGSSTYLLLFNLNLYSLHLKSFSLQVMLSYSETVSPSYS